MIYGILIILAFIGCDLACDRQTQKQPPATHHKVARVYDTYLYQEDIAGMVPAGTSQQDSLALIDQYAQSWVMKHLIAHQATKTMDPGGKLATDIEKQVADFRCSLLGHHYLESVVNTKLNKDVSPQEIEQYYQANPLSFRLKQQLIKGKFVILPRQKTYPSSLKQWLMSEKEEDRSALEQYCKKYAKDYSLDNNRWLVWDHIVTKTAFMNIPDKSRLLKKKSFTAIRDAAYTYYLKIDTYRDIHELAPLEFVSKEITEIIRYKRKLDLINQLKEDVLKQAKDSHHYTIYEAK